MAKVPNNEEIGEKVLEFMGKFNEKIDNVVSSDCERFIKVSLLDYGGLYLQPCVVMLHKFLQPITDETFTLVLEKIYACHLSNDPCIARFIKYYDKNTLECYTDSSDFMMDHMCFLYTNKLSPCLSLYDQINSLLCMSVNQQSSETFRQSLLTMDREEKIQIVNTLIDTYTEALIQLQVIMYNATTRKYHVLNSGTHYRMANKLKIRELQIVKWIGFEKKDLKEVYSQLDIKKPRYTVSQDALFSSCKFQFSTTVGVFNSLTGLYTAKTRFLRFLRYRYFAVWKLHVPYDMYTEQNYEILSRMVSAEKYAQILHDNISPLFVHFLLAPAMIELKHSMDISQYTISQLIHILAQHNDLSSAYFLLEYFPIDPKFVFLIMYIYKKYHGFNSLKSYENMSDHVFNHKKVDEAAWKKEFKSVLDGVTFEEKDSYMDTLMTLKGEKVCVSQKFCFYATIIAVCMIKCDNFSIFVRAFNAKTIPPSRHTKPEYDNLRLNIGVETYKSNLHRAIEILFGKDLSLEDRNMIITMFSIGMFTYFHPETTTELLASVSTLFVPFNVHKKIFLYYGNSDVGKSFLCKIIQEMASPMVCRWLNWDQAMKMKNVIAKNNVTILNDVYNVDAKKFKTLIDNDTEATRQFNHQKYEMHKNQSLFYGATNSIITFKGQPDIDLASVKVFHAIKLTGQQKYTDHTMYSLLDMLTNSLLYNRTIELTEDELTNAMRWLSYASYVLKRDTNFFPSINVNSISNKQYWHDVRQLNNKLYKCLVIIGITEKTGFSMASDTLLNIVNRNLDVIKDRKIKNLTDFKNMFERQYGIKLDNGVTIPNFQQTRLVNHICYYMSVRESPNSVITNDDIEERIRLYDNDSDKDNARSYFQRENLWHYDHQEDLYRNIAFKLNSIKYNGNETQGLYDTCSAEFLVDLET